MGMDFFSSVLFIFLYIYINDLIVYDTKKQDSCRLSIRAGILNGLHWEKYTEQVTTTCLPSS